MSRRRSEADRFLDELLEMLRVAPWWVGPLVILLAWLLFRFIAPAILNGFAPANGNSVDHVVATSAGGADSGDNIVLACRSCNSSKCSRDLFHWWSTTRPGLPPLFVIRIYIKQAIAYAQVHGLDDVPLDQVHGHPFRFDLLPVEYPAPNELIFTPSHEEKWAAEG